MGRKSSAKTQTPNDPPSRPRSSVPLLVVAAIGLTLVAGGAFYWRHAQAEAEQAAAAADAVPFAPLPADIRPHPQATLPPLEFPAYTPPRSPDVIRAAYRFAAEHPEILSYVPCFCGCEHSGHRGNEDCFVHARDTNGDVIEWEPHGMECTICIDVATRSMQLFLGGASVRDIRQTIEKEWAPHAAAHTPTPAPPAQ
jgi:hypothetical protein